MGTSPSLLKKRRKASSSVSKLDPPLYGYIGRTAHPPPDLWLLVCRGVGGGREGAIHRQGELLRLQSGRAQPRLLVGSWEVATSPRKRLCGGRIPLPQGRCGHTRKKLVLKGRCEGLTAGAWHRRTPSHTRSQHPTGRGECLLAAKWDGSPLPSVPPVAGSSRPLGGGVGPKGDKAGRGR